MKARTHASSAPFAEEGEIRAAAGEGYEAVALGYAERSLRPGQAGAGDRLEARLSVAPELRRMVIPVRSVQAVVENWVEQAVETKQDPHCGVMFGTDLDNDVECVGDDGPGTAYGEARRALGTRVVAVASVQSSLQAVTRAAAKPNFGCQLRAGL
ncbi:MAG: hypothetical protein JO352_11760 [Chloroflexi bacterium]|nr:hypothetical protein [Chloroflexota bacterium]